MGKKLTIQDIARLAGVSKATVSRVLNQKQNVDPGTREEILRIMRENSFVPSITASGLAGGRTRLLGALVPDLTWPLIPELMRGVGEVIGHTSYDLILYSVTDANHEKDRSDVVDRIVSSQLVAGLLAVFPGATSRYLIDLHSADFPVVLVDDQGTPPLTVPFISVDNRRGAYTATRHLIQLGHRRIAHIQGPPHYQASQDRLQGYCDALIEAGIAIDESLIRLGDFMPNSGRECASAWFMSSERPSAIFAGSDYMAYGAITAAIQYGLRIPEDIAIIGFDDNPSSAHMSPALTTIKQPFYEMGKDAIRLLLSLVDIAHTSTESTLPRQLEIPRMVFPAKLEVRQTCGAPESQRDSAKEAC